MEKGTKMRILIDIYLRPICLGSYLFV